MENKYPRLTPSEGAVYIALLRLAKEYEDLKDFPGATVNELSEITNKTSSATRAILNSLRYKGLVDGKPASIYESLSTKKYRRRNKHHGGENLWFPKYSVKEFLERHPEVLDYIGKDTIEEILGTKIDIDRGIDQKFNKKDLDEIVAVVEESFKRCREDIEEKYGNIPPELLKVIECYTKNAIISIIEKFQEYFEK